MSSIRFSKTALYDLSTVAQSATHLQQTLANWAALESLPLEHWRLKTDKVDDPDLWSVRKEIDVKKFRDPANGYLQDLNRGLTSLGLPQVSIETFMQKPNLTWKFGKVNSELPDTFNDEEYLDKRVRPSVENIWKDVNTTESFKEWAEEEAHGCYWESGNFLQFPDLEDEDDAFIFKWWFFGENVVILELWDILKG